MISVCMLLLRPLECSMTVDVYIKYAWRFLGPETNNLMEQFHNMLSQSLFEAHFTRQNSSRPVVVGKHPYVFNSKTNLRRQHQTDPDFVGDISQLSHCSLSNYTSPAEIS